MHPVYRKRCERDGLEMESMSMPTTSPPGMTRRAAGIKSLPGSAPISILSPCVAWTYNGRRLIRTVDLTLIRLKFLHT